MAKSGDAHRLDRARAARAEFINTVVSMTGLTTDQAGAILELYLANDSARIDYTRNAVVVKGAGLLTAEALRRAAELIEEAQADERYRSKFSW